jgi:hypothetical protein
MPGTTTHGAWPTKFVTSVRPGRRPGPPARHLHGLWHASAAGFSSGAASFALGAPGVRPGPWRPPTAWARGATSPRSPQVDPPAHLSPWHGATPGEMGSWGDGPRGSLTGLLLSSSKGAHGWRPGGQALLAQSGPKQLGRGTVFVPQTHTPAPSKVWGRHIVRVGHLCFGQAGLLDVAAGRPGGEKKAFALHANDFTGSPIVSRASVSRQGRDCSCCCIGPPGEGRLSPCRHTRSGTNSSSEAVIRV